MHFKRIYMHGFKSFADPVTIEFHPGVTCIVGPNGSGKSNLSDAIRWVLGEQSAKSLRGGKMEDVIFNGTATRKPRGMAEVTLTIDNEEGILPTPFSEVAITRRMYRSGESEYSINGNSCRLKDIRELIMDTGIGVDGYSLIGQGKISEIIENKTEGRRQIFEEAAGIVMYRSKKAEAERKLSNARNNLDRINDIIGEIEGRIGGLKDESEKAEEYIALRDRFKELEINITLKNVEGIDERLNELEAEIENISGEQLRLREKKEEKSVLLQERKERSYRLDEIAEETRRNILSLMDEISELVSREQMDSQRLSSMEEEEKRLLDERKKLSDRWNVEKKNQEKINQRIEKGKEKLEKASAILKQKMEDFAGKSDEAAKLLAQADEAKADGFECIARAKEKRAEAQSYDNIKNAFLNRREDINKERRETEYEAFAAELSKAKEQEDECQGRLHEIEKKLEALKEERQQMEEDEKRISKTIEEFRLTRTQYLARRKTIEEMESNYEGYNYAVKFIMKEKIPGIYGTAAELMEVPEGYETAIETSLGGKMSNIICRDDACAKRAVTILKDAKAGRLTFVPVDSIKNSRLPYDDTAEGFLGLASEIVDFDEEYFKAYEFLLGRIVIADNMDHAIKMAKDADPGLKFVTLDGEVIGGTGAITGGRFKNRTANLLERKAEISRLGERLAELEKDMETSEEKRKQLQDLIREKVKSIGKLTGEHTKTQVELNDRKNEAGNIEEKIRNFDEKVKKWNRELEEIEARVSSSEEVVNNLIFQALEAEKNAREKRGEAEELLRAYEQKKETAQQVSDAITKARIDATQAETEMTGISDMAARVHQQILEITQDLSARENRLGEIGSEREEILKLRNQGSLTDEKSSEKKKLEERLEIIAQEKEVLKKEITELEMGITSFDENLSALSERKLSADMQEARYETQLENLKDKLWENFEISYIQAMEFKRDDFVLNRALRENKEIKSRMAELGDVNIGSIEEYASVKERYDFLISQRKDITDAMGSLNDIISEMDTTIRTRFQDSFGQVAENFGAVFSDLFGGGYAKLMLSDASNPLESEIEIVAQPPEKKLQNINLLSGGEKTMTAIALMFAVLKAKPTPFCILDEVEAALDDDNMVRFAKYLRNFEKIQFALITHQKTTMEYANVLYGVTMPERGVSNVLSLRFGDLILGDGLLQELELE